MDLYNQLLLLPKVELHRHLEGSVRLKTIEEIAKEYHLKLPLGNLREEALALHPMNNLKAVLDRFDIARSCFIDKDTISLIAYRTCIDAASENTMLLELRFSPGFITQPFGHNYEMILESIMEGVYKASMETGILVGLIIICSRDLGLKSTERTIDFALSCKDHIVGIDLAGDELWAPEMFAESFAKAKKAGLNITTHSSETMNPRDVVTCIESLGAQRIGHGIQIIHTPEIMDMVKAKGVTLELCPTSNYITRSTDKIENHPAKRFFDRGINISLNSDDPALFDINLTSELALCVEKMGFTIDEIKQTMIKSLDASFINDDDKSMLRDGWFREFLI